MRSESLDEITEYFADYFQPVRMLFSLLCNHSKSAVSFFLREDQGQVNMARVYIGVSLL